MDNQLMISKRDARDRVRSTVEARVEDVAEYRRSGLSASAFAKMVGISKNTFWNWLQSHGLTQKRGPQSYLQEVLTRLPTLTNRQIKA